MRLTNRLTRAVSLSRHFSSSSSRPPVGPASISSYLLAVGHVLRGARKFTEGDLVQYSEVTGDYNPVHLEDEFAKRVAGFERGRVVHGMLVASLFPSIIASNFPGAIYASQNLKFKLPVYIEDEISAQLEAIHIKEMKKKYMVKFTTKCFANNDILVVDGEAMTILPILSLK